MDAVTAPVLPSEITIGRITYKVEGDLKAITLIGPRGGKMLGLANVHNGDFCVLQGARVFVRLRLAATGELRQLA